jgi:beta-glucanase (GH16 family)
MEYKLLWQDIFEKDGLPNQEIWHFETGGHGFGNHEAQYYTDRLKNAFVKEGLLNIVAYKEDFLSNHYTSAKLTTYQKKHIMHGRIEVKAKLPRGIGTWPAIWMLGVNFREVGWPLCGEIDLLEHVGHNENEVHFSLHSKNNHFTQNNQKFKVYRQDDLVEDFHEYSMDWDEHKITFYLDKKEIVTFYKNENDDVETWPFNQPFYLILNIALGGTWGGPIDDSIFPTVFQFEYVKVYERI